MSYDTDMTIRYPMALQDLLEKYNRIECRLQQG